MFGRYGFIIFLLQEKHVAAPAPSCTLIFNDTISRTADSIHWDYYNSAPHMQAFIGGLADVSLFYL
jgi:hypothetical protein